MSNLALMSIGSEIMRVRRELNLTQEELASKCGFDQRTLSNYEQGKNLPSAKRLEVISKVLGKQWKLI
jgi:transcriptional regulator with XRE-family HTH domain